MFLQSEDHDINDFLSAVNFIAPQGFNLKYFIEFCFFFHWDNNCDFHFLPLNLKFKQSEQNYN